jgi:hypothetical protein
LPLIMAEDLSVGLAELLSFLETDGKFEVLWRGTAVEPDVE